MTQNEELQRQIDELKATVERLQSGESRFESASVKMRRIRNTAVERYYGNWDYFRETDIQICPTQKHGQIDPILLMELHG